MHQFKKNQLRMMGVTKAWLETNLTRIGQSKSAEKEARDVIEGQPAVLAKAGQTSVQTRAVTRRRNEQKKAFQTQLFSLLGPLRLLATRTNDLDLLGLVTIGRTAFKALRPQLQAGVGQKVLAAADAQAAALADSGLTASHLAAAHALLAAFSTGLPDTQTLLDARKNAHAMYEEVHEAQMQQIYELDLAMAVFETLDPALLREYKTAPAILDSGAKPAAKPAGAGA